MPHDVIMPALGMAQETGQLVEWLKKPGDVVTKGEPLFEVETDKSTVEVAAEASGFLNAVLANKGEDVPVGNVIARIGAEKSENPVHEKTDQTAPAKDVPAKQIRDRINPPPVANAVETTDSEGRILASPKARRLAVERDLDLQRLVEMGVPQPYHAADLEKINSTNVGSAYLRIEASASATELLEFTQNQPERGDLRPLSRILSSFAGRALRNLRDEKRIIVQIERPQRPPCYLADPDRPRCTQVQDGTPSLALQDLTETPILRLPNTGTGSVLTVARQGDTLFIALDFVAGEMNAATAQDFVTQFARRLSDPLCHLL